MDVRPDSAVEAAAYRIIQESLTNIARHAGVTACRVRLRQQPSALLVEIEDAGSGFDPAERINSATGLGLIGMRERATLLGGRLVVESARGSGTRVTATLPLHVQGADALADLSPTEVLPG